MNKCKHNRSVFECAMCQREQTDKLVGHVVHGALIHSNDDKRIKELEAELERLREANQELLNGIEIYGTVVDVDRRNLAALLEKE